MSTDHFRSGVLRFATSRKTFESRELLDQLAGHYPAYLYLRALNALVEEGKISKSENFVYSFAKEDAKPQAEAVTAALAEKKAAAPKKAVAPRKALKKAPEKAPEKAPKKPKKEKDELHTFLMSGASTVVTCGANSSGQFRIQFIKNGNQHHCLFYDDARGCVQGLRSLMDLLELPDTPNRPASEMPVPVSAELQAKLKQKAPLVGQPVVQASMPFCLSSDAESPLEVFLSSGKVDDTYFLSWDDSKKCNVVVKQMTNVRHNSISIRQSNRGYETVIYDANAPTDLVSAHKNYIEVHEKLTGMLEK